MARVVFADKAVKDLSRIYACLEDSEPQNFDRVKKLLSEALSLLERHPLIGKPFGKRLRKLIVSRGKTGYVATYAYESMNDFVLVVDLRRQREAGE